MILIASDQAFSLGLEGLRFNKYGSLKWIVCPEVEEEPALEVLKEWGLSQDLAKVSEFAFVSSGSLPRTGLNLVFFVWLSCLSLIRLVMLCRSSTRTSAETSFYATKPLTNFGSSLGWVRKTSSTPSTSEAAMPG